MNSVAYAFLICSYRAVRNNNIKCMKYWIVGLFNCCISPWCPILGTLPYLLQTNIQYRDRIGTTNPTQPILILYQHGTGTMNHGANSNIVGYSCRNNICFVLCSLSFCYKYDRVSIYFSINYFKNAYVARWYLHWNDEVKSFVIFFVGYALWYGAYYHFYIFR